MRKTPEFLSLTRRHSERVLARNHVGRLAFIKNAVADIEPIGYVANGGWIFMRSAYGSKLEALAHSPYVAFEVDEIDGPFDWRSVVVHGTIYLLPADGAPVEQREFKRALALIRRVMPDALTARDPVPERQVIYGLHIDQMEGRAARSRRVTAGKRSRAKAPNVAARLASKRTADGF
jgi:nitroimidazol reductase NimA-like FMN-containing flavoprotein (pyridoxamine 5'-phosphate oxidase superfamily)